MRPWCDFNESRLTQNQQSFQIRYFDKYFSSHDRLQPFILLSVMFQITKEYLQ